MEAPLEIRYAGVVIGRAQEVRSAEADGPSFFIPVRDPMPVGTVLRMRSGDQETPVRVVRAVEAADVTVCGMQVRTIGDAEEVALEFIPPPASAAEKPKAATPTPVIEVDLERMRAETAVTEVAAPENPLAPVTIATPTLVSSPTVKAAEPAPVDAVAGSTVEIAAVPEAVPVAAASSMTGALRNATLSVAIGVSAPEAPTVASVQVREPASPQPDTKSDATIGRNPTLAYGSLAVTASVADTGSAAVTEEQDGSASAASGPGEDLPPARPISGPSGRRKTRRRK